MVCTQSLSIETNLGIRTTIESLAAPYESPLPQTDLYVLRMIAAAPIALLGDKSISRLNAFVLAYWNALPPGQPFSFVRRVDFENFVRSQIPTPEVGRTRYQAVLRHCCMEMRPYEALVRNPHCVICGASAKTGARMNVDHIRPLSKRWDLRLDRRNLQTTCAACNGGKGGR